MTRPHRSQRGRYTPPKSRLKLRVWPDSALTQVSHDVTDFDDRLAELVTALHRIALVEHGLGIAAPQVGRNERVILVPGRGDVPRILVNPVIEPRGLVECRWEGCLSFPNLFAEIERRATCYVSAYDARERPVEYLATGQTAQVIQHEVDHLDGLLITDRFNAEQRQSFTNLTRERGLPKVSMHLGREGMVRFR